MYKILDMPKRMTTKEIMSEFNGKWVFLVDLEGSPFDWFKTAVPAVVADEEFEGGETGIYDKLDDQYDGKTMAWSFLPNELNVFGFSEVKPDEG